MLEVETNVMQSSGTLERTTEVAVNGAAMARLRMTVVALCRVPMFNTGEGNWCLVGRCENFQS